MSGEILVRQDAPSVSFSFRTFWRYTGPGWLMSLAYLDPGNLEADLQAGAYAGYHLIWVLLGAHLLGFLLQVLAARLSVVTGDALAERCRKDYPRWLSRLLWVMSEIAIIGADLQEVIGTSIALNVLFGFPYWLGTIITAVDTFTIMLIHAYRGVRVTEFFIFTSVMVMMGCFWANMIDVAPPAKDVISGFVPSVKSYAVVQMVAIVGAVIMPHNLYLHSGLVKSRKIDRSSDEAVRQANKYFSVDACIALVISFLINIALVCSFAHGFFAENCAAHSEEQLACRAPGIDNWQPEKDAVMLKCATPSGASGYCTKLGIDNGGEAMQGLLGSAGKYVFAIGLLAAGQASTLTGTFSGQIVMEGFLQLKLSAWKRVILTRGVALGPALVIALLREKIPSLSEANEWLNVLQSIQLPFALLPLIFFTTRKSVMREWVLGNVLMVIVVTAAISIIAINFFLVGSTIFKAFNGYIHPALIVALVFIGSAYICLCALCLTGRSLTASCNALIHSFKKQAL